MSNAVVNRTATTGSPAARPIATAAARRVGVQSEGVDDRGQPAPQPGRDDGVEHRERVGRCVQVTLAAADRARSASEETISLDANCSGPGGLARAGRPDQHHQGGVGSRSRQRELVTPLSCDDCAAPPCPTAALLRSRLLGHAVVERSVGWSAVRPRPAPSDPARRGRRAVGSGPYSRVGVGGRGVSRPTLRAASQVTADQVTSRPSPRSSRTSRSPAPCAARSPASNDVRSCAMSHAAEVRRGAERDGLQPQRAVADGRHGNRADQRPQVGRQPERNTASTVRPTGSSQNGTMLGGKMVNVSSGQIRHRYST